MWRARLIARETTDLSVQAALFADRLIAATPRRIGQVKAARLVQEARLYFDPDRAIADEEEALTKRGVWLRHGTGAPATTDVTMTLDTPDALLFDQTVTRIAGDLKELGDTEASRSAAHARSGSSPTPSTPWTCSPAARRSTQPRCPRRCGEPLRPPHPRRPGRDLAVTSTGAASIEKLGAATTQLLTDWLTRFAAAGTKITLGPSSTSTPIAAVDQHDPPERCAKPWSCATRTVSSPAAAATPGSATSTTSPNTSPWKTADHRAKPGPAISHPCAEPTTA